MIFQYQLLSQQRLLDYLIVKFCSKPEALFEACLSAVKVENSNLTYSEKNLKELSEHLFDVMEFVNLVELVNLIAPYTAYIFRLPLL